MLGIENREINDLQWFLISPSSYLFMLRFTTVPREDNRCNQGVAWKTLAYIIPGRVAAKCLEF